MYQGCAIEQALLIHYRPLCNSTSDITMNFLNYRPEMVVPNGGAQVLLFTHKGRVINPDTDAPDRIFPSVLAASRETGIIPKIRVQANMNTLHPRYSPVLDCDVSF